MARSYLLWPVEDAGAGSVAFSAWAEIVTDYQSIGAKDSAWGCGTKVRNRCRLLGANVKARGTAGGRIGVQHRAITTA